VVILAGKCLVIGFGKVKLGARLTDGYLVALKFIDKATLMPRQHEMLVREVTAMQRLAHPHILQLLQVEDNVDYPRKLATGKTTNKKGPKVCVMLVLELSNGGELFDYLMHTGSFDEVLARTYFRQLLASLEVCHNKGVAHRDLKPENLLLDEKFGLKLADFGLASVVSASATSNEGGEQAAGGPLLTCATECGTRSYMSPEVMSRRPYDGAKADLWSAGVVLFILLAGNPPFQVAGGTDWWYRACAAGRHDRFWMAHLRTCPDFPPECQALLNTLFVVDPVKRSSLAEVWEHPWVQGPTLSALQLEECMTLKAQGVERAKVQELKQAQAAKATTTATTRGGDGVGTKATDAATDVFDPYAASHAAFRSVSSSNSAPSSSEVSVGEGWGAGAAPSSLTLAPPPKGLLTYFYIDSASALALASNDDDGDDDGVVSVVARLVAQACEECGGVVKKRAGLPSPSSPLKTVKAVFSPTAAATASTANASSNNRSLSGDLVFDESEEPPSFSPSMATGLASLAVAAEATMIAMAPTTIPHTSTMELVASIWDGTAVAATATATAPPPQSSPASLSPPPPPSNPEEEQLKRIAGSAVYRLDLERRGGGDTVWFASVVKAVAGKLHPLLHGHNDSSCCGNGEGDQRQPTAVAAAETKGNGVAEAQLEAPCEEAAVLFDAAEDDVF